MRIGARLYERAASPPAQPASLWCVGENLALFAGPLGRNALHSHSVPVLLAGLYGRFRLRIAGAGWLTCRTAVVPAGIPYEFDLKGDPLGVLYLEPHVGRADILVPLVRNTLEIMAPSSAATARFRSCGSSMRPKQAENISMRRCWTF